MTGPVADAAARALAAIAAADRPEVWISRFSDEEILAAASSLDARLAAGHVLPLAGLTFAVKDNIDVRGLPTTAACPAYAYQPADHAPAVVALVEAGALCMGKTNLDQFATGLVGTRSPYGAVRNAIDPTRISGGSSSGSAVAVALDMVDFSLGTDTAGSGRVPAALNGIVGFKATYGLVSTTGVIPACRSFDCVTVFARDVDRAESVMAILTANVAHDQRSFPADAPLGPPDHPVVAHPAAALLADLPLSWVTLYQEALAQLEAQGCQLVEIDLEPFLAAGRLLYQGAFVAERYHAVGRWIDAHPGEADPTVGAIIGAAASVSAADFAADLDRLVAARALVEAEWQRVGADSLVLPTTTGHPTLEEVAADPIGVNTRLGQFTTFLNLLDQCAVAVPAGRAAGLPFGVSCIGPAFSDRVQADVARLVEGSGPARLPQLSPPALSIAVVGAHLAGQPLHHQLSDRGARLVRVTSTAPSYRLYALDTVPPKPGLVRVADGGASITLEVWELSPAGFGDFVAHVPAPMAIGTVALQDGSSVSGFLCEPFALDGALDITDYGGWVAYLRSGATASVK
ncbi:MAG TPA: allophanate hydrolase [Acidimicrobiales bacterium]|nr:allophanate hydrolase [Acidimicrobiales bacterium]